MNRNYWLQTNWLRESKKVSSTLKLCYINTTCLEDIIKPYNKIRKRLITNIKILDLYLMDLYCLNTIYKPAFCISNKELNCVMNKILIHIRPNSLLLLDLLLSSLYGGPKGREQIDYFLKWNEMNVCIFTNIWDNYDLQEKYSLSRKEANIQNIRDSYLRSLDTLNKNNKVCTTKGNKLLTSKTTNNLINTLLNS